MIVGVVLHALPAADRPHPAAVRARPRRAALPRRPALGGRPDPRLHPVDHGRRAAVRRRPPGRGRHPRQRARLRAAGRAGGRGARRPQPLRGAAPSARSDGGCTASRSWCSCACCRCPSTSTSSPRSRTCSSRKLPPRGAERPLAITHVPAAPVAALDRPPEGLVGVASLADLSWKQVLDAFSCTECGRCTAVCPATAAGTPLAPRQLILDIRDRLYEHPEEQRTATVPSR